MTIKEKILKIYELGGTVYIYNPSGCTNTVSNCYKDVAIHTSWTEDKVNKVLDEKIKHLEESYWLKDIEDIGNDKRDKDKKPDN